jgi:hypothetical protein
MEVLELIYRLVQFVSRALFEGVAGWRYLLSSTYRAQLRLRWSTMPRTVAAGEVLTLVLGVVSINLMVSVGLWLLLR